MTNQEAFDKMMEHLRSLKGRSFDKEKDHCVYNGTMCAVGALMTDEEQEKFGGYIGGVLRLLSFMVRKGHVSTLHTLDFYLLEEMQKLHDNPYNWGIRGFDAEGEAKRVAKKFNLTYT